MAHNTSSPVNQEISHILPSLRFSKLIKNVQGENLILLHVNNKNVDQPVRLPWLSVVLLYNGIIDQLRPDFLY